MAVTLDVRPIMTGFSPVRNWNAVKNPVVYKFTTTGGPFTNYRIEAEVFRASDNTSLTGGVKFSFSSNAANITIADISTIVKAYLKADWNNSNEIEQITSLKVYIKYQELYDGSATPVVDDVANPIHCVLAGFQVKEVITIISGTEFSNAFGGNMIRYQPGNNDRKFLSIFDRPKQWRGYPATISFIHALTGLRYRINEYNAADTLIAYQDGILLDPSEDAVTRFSFPSLNAATKKLLIDLILTGTFADYAPTYTFPTEMLPWKNIARTSAGNPLTQWVWNSGQFLDNGGSNVGTGGFTWIAYLELNRFVEVGAAIQMIVDVLVPNTKSVEINLYVWKDSETDPKLVATLAYTGTGLFESKTLTKDPITITEGKINRIGIDFKGLDNVAGAFNLDNILVKIKDPTLQTEQLTYDVEDPCDNPVLLFWKNSLGGDAFWLFEHSQEAGYNYSGTKKAKRMTLFAEHLTLNQWEAINELNTLGEVYKENIVEFTSALDKTHKRDGAQVYIVDATGNKTGVIVIPTNSVINTRDELHSIEIDVEYPERTE